MVGLIGFIRGGDIMKAYTKLAIQWAKENDDYLYHKLVQLQNQRKDLKKKILKDIRHDSITDNILIIGSVICTILLISVVIIVSMIGGV